MSTLKKLISLYALSIMLGSYLMELTEIVLASRNDWIITIYYNSLHEALPETIMYVVGLPAIIYWFRNCLDKVI